MQSAVPSTPVVVCNWVTSTPQTLSVFYFGGMHISFREALTDAARSQLILKEWEKGRRAFVLLLLVMDTVRVMMSGVRPLQSVSATG